MLFDLTVESFQRLEVISLVRVIEGFTEIKIPQLLTLTWARRQSDAQQEPDSRERRSTHGLPVSDFYPAASKARACERDAQRPGFDILGECKFLRLDEFFAVL